MLADSGRSSSPLSVCESPFCDIVYELRDGAELRKKCKSGKLPDRRKQAGPREDGEYPGSCGMKRSESLEEPIMAAPPITINADEVNCLIYAYLKDSGHFPSFFALSAAHTSLQASNTLRSVFSMKVTSITPSTLKNKFLEESS